MILSAMVAFVICERHAYNTAESGELILLRSLEVELNPRLLFTLCKRAAQSARP